MVACLREAIHVRRTQARGWPHFNVIYGTDSDSCAHEVEENWQLGNLGAVSKSAIAPLVETFLHLRLELHARVPLPRWTRMAVASEQVTGNKEDTPGRASLERPRTREPTTMP